MNLNLSKVRLLGTLISLILLATEAAIANATTFIVCDKTPELVPQRNYSVNSLSLVTHFSEYNQNRCTRVIQAIDFRTDADAGRIEPAGEKGFISTVLHAYKGHHNLVIRPDDIWIAIISQFALYINGNAEKFRDRFVDFNGTRRLKVNMKEENFETASHATFVELMTGEIHKNIIDKEVRDWITPNFTTTTRDDKVAAGIVLMSGLKTYFEYVQSYLCGIPKITLEGTEDDWRNLAARLFKLRSYELESWVDNMLRPILKQFVRAKAGKVDEEFWSSIVSVNPGCGWPTMSGWITAFSVFNAGGQWQGRVKENQKWPELDLTKVASGLVYTDVIICDNGVRHDAVVFAGHLGQQIIKDGYTLKPRVGWAIALRNATAVRYGWVDGQFLVALPEEKRNSNAC